MKRSAPEDSSTDTGYAASCCERAVAEYREGYFLRGNIRRPSTTDVGTYADPRVVVVPVPGPASRKAQLARILESLDTTLVIRTLAFIEEQLQASTTTIISKLEKDYELSDDSDDSA